MSWSLAPTDARQRFLGGLVGAVAIIRDERGTEGLSRVGAWHAIAFRTKRPPNLAYVGLVRAHHTLVGKQVVVTASSTDALSPDAQAIVQVGTECAPR